MKSKTQLQLLKGAKRAYFLPLNKHSYEGAARFSVYLDNGKGLECLWPNGSPQDKLIESQVEYARDSETIPKYHFAVGNCGYSRSLYLAEILKGINSKLEIFILSGRNPSPIRY